MESGKLTEEVAAFIVECIDTVPHLEALLLLRERAPRAWTEAELAARLYLPSAQVRRIVQDLMRKGLVGMEGEGFVFSVADSKAATVAAVAQAYRTQLARVASLVHGKASPAVREFSRAFKLKGD